MAQQGSNLVVQRERAMAVSTTTLTSSVELDNAVLLLENGDRLTRAEFERRYEAMPHLKKAELIEGVVYVPSPVRYFQHGSPHAQLIGWLIQYAANTPGVGVADNTSVRLISTMNRNRTHCCSSTPPVGARAAAVQMIL